MRLQPLPIEVPEEEPFRHDLLGRKQFGEALAASLTAVEGPCVFALDGPWGTGKTTFVRMFTQHLKNAEFRVVEINAWDTDYADDPLAALVSRVAAAETDKSRRDKFKKAGVGVLKVLAPAAIRAVTYGVLDLSPVMEKGTGDVLAKFAENGLAQIEEVAKSMRAFKQRLKDLAEQGGDKPMVVIVDELDRCRPTYAVEMLETIKHAFDVDGVLFVFAVNRKQLDRSATVLYGSAVDTSESYFKRFFDEELRLPEPDRTSFVRTLIAELLPNGGRTASQLLGDFLAASPHGIRMVQHFLRRYSIIAASFHPDDTSRWMLPAFAVLRLINEDDYRAFLANSISDEELIDRVFAARWSRPLRETTTGSYLEAAVIAVSMVRNGDSRLRVKLLAEEGDRSREIVGWTDAMSQPRILVRDIVPTVAARIEMFELASA